MLIKKFKNHRNRQYCSRIN